MNRLSRETSPYLLQHAHNPVDWYPWGEEALQLARQTDRAIIVSIGYSACHWCHVMERESFENEQIARVMNEYFVCIKIDREERPDVDQIYMDAVHLMGLQGGWPLNVFLMPDGKPFYGGTYFPASQWMALLRQIAHAFVHQRSQLQESAEGFAEAIQESEIEKMGLPPSQTSWQIETLDTAFENLARTFDRQKGGLGRAPKFPMPSIYSFLLAYHGLTDNSRALDQVCLTLDRMAKGGIYDAIGGGFARYSVDDRWFAPHFEKMLYDNGQLISLYSEAFSLTQRPLYQRIVQESIQFVARELTSEEGGFYSALDADSEGVEGKFYAWTNEQIEQCLGNEAPLAQAYFRCEKEGNWEHRLNILFAVDSDADFAQKNGLSRIDLRAKIAEWKRKLFEARSSRIRPSLDDKILAGWNGLMLKGLADAYAVFGDADYLKMANRNAHFIENRMTDGFRLFRSYKNGQAKLLAYLEDYALVIEGLIALYQAGFEEKWLFLAKGMTDYVIDNFYDPAEELFFFTDRHSEELIARKKELFDNVISASNSVMAGNLYVLSLFFENAQYEVLARKMMGKMAALLPQQIRFMANWGKLYAMMLKPPAEVVITGSNYLELVKGIQNQYFPFKIMAASGATSSRLPLFEGRLSQEKCRIFVCRNRVCQLPVETVEEAWKQLKR
jgi:uncharacterized protein